MTCVEIIEEVTDDICINYCKYPDLWAKGEIEHEEDEKLCDSEFCANCPLSKLK